MKKNFKYVFMFLLVFSFTVLFLNVVQADKKQQTVSETTETVTHKLNENYLYRISDFKGKLAIYEGDSKIPYKVYDTYISSLPLNDQEILKAGICLNSFAEVKKIIEEYTS